MIHQLPLAILEKHLIPILKEDTLPNLRGSCELLCDLSSRRFARFQSKIMTLKTNEHTTLTNQLLTELYVQESAVKANRQRNDLLYQSQKEMRDQLADANVLIHKLDSAIQKHAPQILLEPKNTTKPKYSGRRNGPVENFKQWLIHENGEPAAEICSRSCSRLDELKETHSFYSSIYHPRLPWFRYIELHMDISDNSEFREGTTLPKTLKFLR
jgi:hypothetical protein